MATATTLRPQSAFASTSSPKDLRQSTLRKNMSITQTYYLAHKARGKLSREAAQPDHDLRLLVGHANLLDTLMLELADAEREQERWFNQSVRGANKNTSYTSSERRVQWADQQIIEEEEYESDSSDSDSDDDFEEYDTEMAYASPIVLATQAPKVQYTELTEEEDDEEDVAHLSLVRTSSHTSPPPELIEHDSDSSDDEAMPPSPPQPTIVSFSEKEVSEHDGDVAVVTEQGVDVYQEKYYLPARNPARLVTAISVY